MHNSIRPRSGRYDLTQGEASAASETVGNHHTKDRARFSGRQNDLSPAKAGSLRAFVHRHFYFTIIFVLLAGFCSGCNRSNGISSTTGGLPGSTATPAEVSSSAQVVKINLTSATIAKGGSTDTTINLTVSPGYHINANPATFPYLIATEIKAGNTEGITSDKPIYPVAKKQKFEFAEEALAVYEGNVDIKLPLKASATAVTGERTLPITVRVQACDTEKCFPPATINTKIAVEVQ